MVLSKARVDRVLESRAYPPRKKRNPQSIVATKDCRVRSCSHQDIKKLCNSDQVVHRRGADKVDFL